MEWYKDNVSMLDYLPQCLSSADLFVAMAEGVDYGVSQLKAYAEKVLKNCYIGTADLSVIVRYEKLWGLSPDGLSLNARRERIIAKMRQKPPINEALLKLMMSGILGNLMKTEKGSGDYSIIFKYREQTGEENIEFAKSLLRELIPANMVMTVLYCFVEWQNIRPYSWGQAATYTWEEVMTKGIELESMEV